MSSTVQTVFLSPAQWKPHHCITVKVCVPMDTNVDNGHMNVGLSMFSYALFLLVGPYPRSKILVTWLWLYPCVVCPFSRLREWDLILAPLYWSLWFSPCVVCHLSLSVGTYPSSPYDFHNIALKETPSLQTFLMQSWSKLTGARYSRSIYACGNRIKMPKRES